MHYNSDYKVNVIYVICQVDDVAIGGKYRSIREDIIDIIDKHMTIKNKTNRRYHLNLHHCGPN